MSVETTENKAQCVLGDALVEYEVAEVDEV